MFRRLEDVERQAVVNLQARGKIARNLNPATMRVAFAQQGKNNCVTIAAVKTAPASSAQMYFGWAKYNLNDAKKEGHRANALFGRMKAFARALREIPVVVEAVPPGGF